MSEQHAVEHDAHHDHADIDRHVRVYVLVFVTLLVLTMVTVAISYLDLPTVPAIALALLVAIVKGSLVACFFMHLISEKKLILWVMALTVFFFLGVLLGPWATDLDQVKLFGT